MECIYQGAEAVLYRDGDVLIKKRVAKGYRLPHVDTTLRVQRHRREVKVLKELQKKRISAPTYISDDEKECVIKMRFLNGIMLKQALTQENAKMFAVQIGSLLAQLHNAGIIHGDLTTSNMMVDDRLYLLDFGLSFFSKRIEDKAVDLHLLRTAIESKHPSLYPLLYDEIIVSYKGLAVDYAAIASRLQKVEERGRNKIGS